MYISSVMRKASIFFHFFFLLVQIYFALNIGGSHVSGKRPIGHLIETHSGAFLLQHSSNNDGPKETIKDNGKMKEKNKKSKNSKKSRKDDYNLLSMLGGLFGGGLGGGGVQVELLRLIC